MSQKPQGDQHKPEEAAAREAEFSYPIAMVVSGDDTVYFATTDMTKWETRPLKAD
jgi:hypothetical protein